MQKNFLKKKKILVAILKVTDENISTGTWHKKVLTMKFLILGKERSLKPELDISLSLEIISEASCINNNRQLFSQKKHSIFWLLPH
jgi:hypothetical protein